MASSNPWLFAGLASTFPNIEPDTSTANRKTKLNSTAASACDDTDDQPPPPPCKILQTSDKSAETELLTPDDAQMSIGIQPQVLIFRYRDKFHAIDHACPHRTYPLSRGSIYDIEDFGIVLSAGIACPKHGWTFDLFTGESDRGGYRLSLWEVELRSEAGEEEGVWVRRKVRKRIG